MKLSIIVLPGDGIGPEVVAEALKVLHAVGESYRHDIELHEHPFGSAALDATGKGFPDALRESCLSHPAIFLGAVGDPRHDRLPPAERPEAALLELRRELSAFANLRPIVSQFVSRQSPFREEALSGVDMLIVRELTGGLYFGQPRGIVGEGDNREAFNTMRYRVSEIERVARVAFEAAQRRRQRVMSVDKMNVLETSKLWREVVQDVSADYPDVTLEHVLVDRAAMEIIANPKRIDVLLTENLFGDILSDEASVLAGSLGLLPSASLGGAVGLYEPVHGSAPDIAGKGVANPIGAIASMAMLLRHSFDLEAEAKAVEAAIASAFENGFVTPDLAPEGTARTTEDVGNFVAEHVSSRPRD
jgi:3-isopropylmalate dehydrogenase